MKEQNIIYKERISQINNLMKKIDELNIIKSNQKAELEIIKLPHDYDYYSWQIKLNQSFEGEATLHMLNAIQYYADKNDYLNDDIVIFDLYKENGIIDDNCYISARKKLKNSNENNVIEQIIGI